MKQDNREIKYVPRAMISGNGMVVYFTSSSYMNRKIEVYDKEIGTYRTEYDLEFCDALRDEPGVQLKPAFNRSDVFDTAEQCQQYLVARNKRGLDNLLEKYPKASTQIIKSFYDGLNKAREIEKRILEENTHNYQY